MTKNPKSKAAHPKAKPAASGAPATEAHAPLGKGGELHQQAESIETTLTTNQGVPIADNQNSLKAGPRGPVLLQDFILREKITHFDHERIPERVVHARGSAAHGFFECLETIAPTSRAADFPAAARARRSRCSRASRPSPATRARPTCARDVRGFAVKFYTQEGNFDLVGNNIPVFFIQDAIKFPDLIHAAKQEPDREFPQAADRARHLLGLHLADARKHAHDHVDHVGPRHPAQPADDGRLRHPHIPAGRTPRANPPSSSSTGGRSSACSRWSGTRR